MAQRTCDWNLSISADPVTAKAPIPGVLALLGIGFAGLGATRRCSYSVASRTADFRWLD